jgi:predicted secreted protein
MTLRMRLGAVLAALAAIATMAAALPSPAAAASAKKPGPVIVRDLGVQVRLVPGERMKIILPTNRTTGYTWLAEGGCCTANDLPIARVDRGKYTAPSTDLVGAPGTTTWTVVALRPGTTTITIVTRPPGAQNTMQDETLGTVTLVVMQP